MKVLEQTDINEMSNALRNLQATLTQTQQSYLRIAQNSAAGAWKVHQINERLAHIDVLLKIMEASPRLVALPDGVVYAPLASPMSAGG